MEIAEGALTGMITVFQASVVALVVTAGCTVLWLQPLWAQCCGDMLPGRPGLGHRLTTHRLLDGAPFMPGACNPDARGKIGLFGTRAFLTFQIGPFGAHWGPFYQVFTMFCPPRFSAFLGLARPDLVGLVLLVWFPTTLSHGPPAVWP